MTGFNRRIVTLLISLVIVVTYSLTPFAVAYASEQASETDTSNSQELPETQENSNSDETASGPGEEPPDNNINTGDSVSSSTQDTTLNHTEIQVQGEITSDGCEVEGSVECDVSVVNEVQSQDNTSEAESVSGENGAENLDGSTSITTGDSLSVSESENLLNTTIIEASGEAESNADGDSEEDGASKIEIDNKAEHEELNSAESISGANTIATNSGDAKIETGTSIAEASQVNIVNTNFVGSEIEFLHESIKGDDDQDINLNELWKAQSIEFTEGLLNGIEEGDLSIVTINDAKITVEAISQAISGQNSILDSEGNSTIKTGDSYASSNIFNLININFIGSNLLLGVINVFGNLSGNIVVPNMDRFNEQKANGDHGSSDIKTYQSAYLTSTVEATADSGENTEIGMGDQEMEAGEAVAVATSTNYSNLNLYFNNWFMMFLNNFGNWSGQVKSWDNPGSKNEQEEASFNYNNVQPSGDENLHDDQSMGSVDITNKVEVDATVKAGAVSGQNSIDTTGDSVLKTGKSVAFANLFNLVNTNIIGSNIFLPIVNIFGSWSGDLVFAYPALEVKIFADRETVGEGERVGYTVEYLNAGYEDARNSVLTINLPEEITVEGVDAQSYQLQGNRLILDLGTVKHKSSGKISFTGIVNGDSGQELSLLELIVKPVSAAERYKELVAQALVETSDTQSDSSKNTSSAMIIMHYTVEEVTTGENEDEQNNDVSNDPEEKEKEAIVQEPNLELLSSNNTGEFVYPGDVITFFVEVKNSGEGEARDVEIDQEIVYGESIIVENAFEVGTIYPGKTKKLTFKMAVPSQAGEGHYDVYFKGRVTAGEHNGNESNVSENGFDVKFKLMDLFMPPVEAKETKGKGNILGAKTESKSCPQNNTEDIYFLLLILVTLLWIFQLIKNRQLKRKLDEVLGKLEKLTNDKISPLT